MVSIDDFWKYVTENEKQIKREVAKNITMDSELFDDVYQDTIVKVAEAIQNGKDVNDLRFYFFISFKNNYIQSQNKKRKEKKLLHYDTSMLNDILDEAYSEERNTKINMLFDIMREILEENFSERDVDIYTIYMKLKSGRNRISYEKFAKIMDTDVKDITRTIQNVKNFVRTNDEIISLKKYILYDDDFDFLDS